MTALVTPFSDGGLDEAAFRGLVDWQIDEGTHGLVPVGTTGESPTLSHEEHQRVVEICIDEAKGRVPVIAGAGSNNTHEAVELARHAEKAGADARAGRDALLQQADARKGSTSTSRRSTTRSASRSSSTTSPPRSVDRHVGRDDEAAVRAEEHRRREGRDRQHRRGSACSGRRMGPDFIQLSGEDMTALGFMAHGGHGCISVTSNVAPRLCAELQEACLARRLRARR